jgi:hypothetical protein
MMSDKNEHTEILDLIDRMITKLGDQSYDNNRRYATDDEKELVRKGRYGVEALQDFRDLYCDENGIGSNYE